MKVIYEPDIQNFWINFWNVDAAEFNPQVWNTTMSKRELVSLLGPPSKIQYHSDVWYVMFPNHKYAIVTYRKQGRETRIGIQGNGISLLTHYLSRNTSSKVISRVLSSTSTGNDFYDPSIMAKIREYAGSVEFGGGKRKKIN